MNSADADNAAFTVAPEMFDTGFSFKLDITADRDATSASFLSEFASRLGVTVQGGISVDGPAGKGLNRALVYAPTGELIFEYDKIHPFTFGREGERFVGGDRVGRGQRRIVRTNRRVALGGVQVVKVVKGAYLGPEVIVIPLVVWIAHHTSPIHPQSAEGRW